MYCAAVRGRWQPGAGCEFALRWIYHAGVERTAGLSGRSREFSGKLKLERELNVTK